MTTPKPATPAPATPTTRLRDGRLVLAKLYHGCPTAKTYANRTQAHKAAAKHGGYVCGRYPFYVAMEAPPPNPSEPPVVHRTKPLSGAGKMTQNNRERAEAITNLRQWYPIGSTVYTILRHTSRSGMSREIGVVAAMGGGNPRRPNYAVAKAIGARVNQSGDGVKIAGCGMDMGFHLAYNLSYALYPQGFGCTGEGCCSNDHSNGDRDYTPHADAAPHWHKDGGYALNHRWL